MLPDSVPPLDATCGAAAVIFDELENVLLIKENYGRRRWGLPGGALEDGETAEEAVLRETLEETGLTVAIDHLVGRYTLDNDFTAYAFRCTVVEGTPVVQSPDEIAWVGWHPAHHLPTRRSNVLHYAVPDALHGCRGVVGRGPPRVS